MDYARAWPLATGSDPHGVELRLTARLRRQQILDSAVRYDAFIGEAALRTRVGDAATSARQAASIRTAARRANVTVRAVPSDAGPHPGQLGSFLAMDFDTAPSVVLVELLRSNVFMDEHRQTWPYLETVARLSDVALSETVGVRDTKDRTPGQLTVPRRAWLAALARTQRAR